MEGYQGLERQMGRVLQRHLGGQPERGTGTLRMPEVGKCHLAHLDPGVGRNELTKGQDSPLVSSSPPYPWRRMAG